MFRKKLAPPTLDDEPPALPAPGDEATEVALFDFCVTNAPAAQNAIDLFEGTWASTLPTTVHVRAGTLPLFDDFRIRKVLVHLDSIKSFRVLELGPLEGGHTFMLHEGGARIIAIEGNAEAYLKCLVVKEILNLNRAHFYLGDFNKYLVDAHDHFDLVLASGVLYESADPLTLLEGIGHIANKVAIWTHYFESTSIAARDELAAAFGEATVTQWREHTLHLHRLHVDDPSARPAFCDDPMGRPTWLERDELIAVMGSLGYSRVTVLEDDVDHPKGPAMLLCAER